jgi:hypothetical protein
VLSVRLDSVPEWQCLTMLTTTTTMMMMMMLLPLSHRRLEEAQTSNRDLESALESDLSSEVEPALAVAAAVVVESY